MPIRTVFPNIYYSHATTFTGAPLKRNEKMVDMADAVLVVWDGSSKGAEYTLKYAKKMNKPTTLVQP